MESRTENSNGTTVPKKSKSLDLKSLYKSKLSVKTAKENLKRIGSSSGDGDEKRKRKKARKEVSLSSLENGDGSSELKLGMSQRLSSSMLNRSMLNRVSFSVCGDDFHIPKRKRSFMGRKKSEPGPASNLVEQPSHKSGYGNPVLKLGTDDLDSGVESFKIKHKKEFDEFKENRNSDSNSVQHFKENGECASHSVVNSGGDSSLTKSRRKNRNRKRKTSALDITKVSKEVEPLVSSCKISDGLQEDEEENLEENAARMLSSRFDPSCTGFSVKGSNGLSFFQSSSQSIVNRGLKSQSGSESTSADTAGRVLRPRKQYKNKGNSRKRRHFYEILLGDVDVYWVLNRKIKIFWPLDQSWYYGRVDGYDEGSKLYHIKYDDRDVEWVNLHTERFKLLLLRSEVPGNAKGERAIAKCRSSDSQKGSKSRKERQRTKENTEDDHCGGSSMDSEPIISWLARSSHRFRSSFQGVKKQKTSVTLPSTMPSFLYDEPVTKKGHLSESSMKGVKNNLSSDYASQDKLGDDFRMKSTLQSATCNKDGKQPIVYFRRRIRKPAPMSPHIYEEKHAIISASGPVSLDHMFGGVENMKNSRDDRDEVEGPLCFTYKAGVSKVFWGMESASFKFGLNFPMCFVLNDSFQSEYLWLLYPLFLLQYGTVMTKWPRVCLEMLFVDNVVGLRFLLFEGCLNMAVAFVFFVLRVFHQSACRGKYVDLQFPCTSIGFKFSGLHVIKKPLVFEFYNFSGVKNSKWMGLDSKLKRHCLLSKQLHLSECTYDNIQALQNGSSGFSITSISGSSPVKVMRKRNGQGINIMGVSKVSTQADTHQYSDAGERKLPPFTLSFAAAPTFFLCFHLKLLMEQSATHISFCDHAPLFDQEDPSLVTNGSTSTDGCSNRNSEIILRKDIEILSNGAAGDGGSRADLDHPSTFSDQILSQKDQNIGPNGAGTSISHCSERGLGTTHLSEWQSHHLEQELGSLPLSSSIRQDKADDGSHSYIGDLSIQIPAVDQFEKPGGDGDLCDAEHSPDFSWNINGGVMPSSNPTARRSSWYPNRNSSSSFGFQSHVWSDGKTDSLYSNGPKKPRTQVSYSVPSAGYEFSSRQRNHHQKGLPHKRIRKASEKKSSDVARGPEKNFECLSCGANVLITLGYKGWRESGAHIVLELFDRNEWRLSVKLSGITRYSYKAHQFLQPGSTNRYTHAMMWKGGKDWILEFPDRSQWALFKEMHEECYNRNIRAASVKNIPIPGVHLIEENDDNGCEAIVRSCMYFQQVETDVEMALDPSRVMYDMDSEDEQWIANAQNSVKDNSDLRWISEEMFEKTIDMFEKAAYAKNRNHFTPDEIEELMVDVGPLCIVKIIYDHWQQRREKKGMALIRHFQPPLWERYQKQVREWEIATTKNNAPYNACEDKVTTLEKPAMFAFCLKPRGLESVNKGFKHRSQKKISVSGHANSNLDQDGFRRRQNALPFGDEKFLYQGHNFDCFDESSLALTSPRVFLPRDAGSLKYHPTSNGSGYRNHVPKFHQSRYELPHNRHHLADPKRQGIEQLDASVLEELRLRDAVAEAHIKRHVAKLKRDKAKRLLYKADVAIHKAMTALMIAEAMNASEDSVGEMKASEDSVGEVKASEDSVGEVKASEDSVGEMKASEN